MKRLLAAAVIVLLGSAWAGAGDTRVTLPPDLAPLKARLVVAKGTYTLDPAQKGAEFRKKLQEAPAQNAPNGIRIQGGQIQIQAVPLPGPAPAPAPVPVPGRRGGRRIGGVPIQPVPQAPKAPAPAEGKKDEGKKDDKGAKKEKKDDDVQVQGNVQGVIVLSDGQGKTVVKDIVPNEEKKADKKDQPAKDGKKQDGKQEDKGKKQKEQPNVQEFKIQAQGGQIQIQGHIQVQGGVPGGPPQVQIFVVGAPQRPLPPEVDLVLELTNTSGREMTLLVGGGRSQLDLKLDGPGAITVPGGGSMHVEPRSEVKLAPGAVHKVPIKRLQHGRYGQSGSYWTEPGQYKLTATYKALVKATSEKEKDKPIEATASPATIKVVEGK